MRTITVLIGLLSLAGCGGSGNTSSNNTTLTPVTYPVSEQSIVMVADEPKTQQALDLFLYYPGQKLTNITWQQTSGPEVTLLSANSKAIAFTPVASGDYGFDVSFQADNGERQTLHKSITVADGTVAINARLGHAALEGNKVSLRAWLAPEFANNTVSWQQIAGPNVNLNDYQNGDLAIFFDAPQVNKDQLLVFAVTTTINGTQYRDDVGVLIEDSDDIASNAYFDERVAAVLPYRPDSPYASALVPCVYSNQLSSSCTLGKLPLLAQQTTTPTVDDVLDRLVVSHAWMGDRFKAFLEQYDPNGDFRNLLRATTAVVISYDVRPSFYWAATGAIYLDANNFWLTPDERDTLNEAPDYRAAFGKELQFVMPWRYVKNNDYASNYVAATSRVSRPAQDTLYRLSSLLYHELAHANDFFPSSEWFSHSANERVLDAAQSTDFESDQLSVLYPLSSQEMRNLAQVSFAGETATATQKSYQPQDVSGFFSPDVATDYYNFSSLREDYAMLFEELMMYSRFQVQRDVAVTNQPQGDEIYANDYIVDWGQRGRIGEAAIKARASFVAKHVLPEFDSDSAIAQLPAPKAMKPGDDWIENLLLASSNSPSKAQSIQASTAAGRNTALRQYIAERRIVNKPLPKH